MDELFDPKRYLVTKIDGDYAWLARTDAQAEPMLVARALLPAEIEEGTRLLWKDLEYTIDWQE